MNLLELEVRLQTLLETKLTRIFSGQKPESLIVQRLTAELQEGSARQDQNCLGVAPSVYTLFVPPHSLDDWNDPLLQETLVEVLKSATQESKLSVDFPPRVRVASNPVPAPGDFTVVASNDPQPLEKTQDLQTESERAPADGENPTILENAFLFVEGITVFQLKRAVLNIGRRLDNEVVIDDSRVSRTHLQLRAINGRFVVFDLGLSGGNFINGQRAGERVLYAGDVISLAGVSLVYG